MKTFFSKAIVLALFFAVHVMAKHTFYFLPPNEPEWIKKTPYIFCTDAGETLRMSLDPTTCGWYKVDIPDKYMACDVVIWQGAIKKISDIVNDVTTDRIGVNGLDEDPTEWDEDWHMPTFIRFEEKFQLGDPVYFDAKNGWTLIMPPEDPKQKNRCSYNMAAIIYDKHKSRLESFNYDNTGSGNGIKKGIAKPMLVKDANGIPKMEFNRSKNGWDGGEFNNIAFKCTKGKNAMVCYDMPFARDNTGLWTFDSDQLCVDGTVDLKRPYPPGGIKTTPNSTQKCGTNGGLVGGFFPNRLNGNQNGVNDDPVLDPNCTYDDCTSCYGEVKADGFILPTGVSSYCFERSRESKTPSCTENSCCGSAFSDGDFHGADGGSNGIYPWGNNANVSGNKNQYFCFETHAEFTYEKGQEFFFRGDDDIWVFINNRIVIDNGGSHLAAPGYVALDSIGKKGRWESASAVSDTGPDDKYPELVEGKEYPLDIFFCDRRETMSNIRISTDMYISQKNGLFKKEGNGTTSFAEVCMTQEGGGSCATLLGNGGLGTQELCGNEVAGLIEFYIISRRGDGPFVLNRENTENCKATSNTDEILCYDGITVNLKSGKAKADKNKVNLNGTWYLYARVTEAQAAKMKPPPEDVKLATFTSQPTIRMVHGDIREINKNTTITKICQGDYISAVTSELKPVCFSDGIKDDKGFIIDSAEVGGSTFGLHKIGFTNDLGNELKVYADSNGQYPIKNPLDTTFTIPGGPTSVLARPNSGSVPGVLVLWVTGDYKQDEQDFEYKINVRNRPSSEEVVLKSIVPEFQWIKKFDSKPIPDSLAYGSKFNDSGNVVRENDGKLKRAWVSDRIKLTLRAYNRSTGATCRTCKFSFASPLPAGYEAYAINSKSDTLKQRNKNLVDINGLELDKGVAEIEIVGKVDLWNGHETDPYYAKVNINGVSKLQHVKWDSLQFEQPPVPIPDNPKLFDDNGDGIGDRLVIAYNRGFRSDSLPNMIEIFWDSDTTIRYGISTSSLEGRDTVYSADGVNGADRAAKIANNIEYWKKYLRLDKNSPDLGARKNLLKPEIENLKDTIVLVLDSAGLLPARFSKKTLTQGEGKIISWASFKIPSSSGVVGDSMLYNLGSSPKIDEKIPAVVIAAKYAADSELGCGTNSTITCADRLTIEFSEPVFMDKDTTIVVTDNEAMNPFAYMLRNFQRATDFSILKSGSLPRVMKYGSKETGVRPSEKGDTAVYLTFYRWRDANGGNSGTPMPGDSIKFASVGVHSDFLKNIFVDAKGNKPNPKEIGKQIEGRNPFMQEKVAIGEIDPNSDRTREDIAKVLLDHIHSADPSVINRMYTKARPIEVLPVPSDWTVNEIIEYYKGTIGLLFNPDVFNTLSDYEDKYGPIPDNAITFYAKVFYHTNLGNYVAGRNIALKCDNPIFPLSDDPARLGKPSCRDGKNKIYVAWNMKDFNGRFVGTGAYVGIYDFRWEIDYPAANEELTKLKKESIEKKAEMHGVKRVKRPR